MTPQETKQAAEEIVNGKGWSGMQAAEAYGGVIAQAYLDALAVLEKIYECGSLREAERLSGDFLDGTEAKV